MKNLPQNKPTVPWMRKRRKWPWFLAIIAILIILTLILTPVYLSSNGFARMLQAKLSRSTGGQVGIGDLNVGWFKGVRLSEFSFRDSAGWTRVNVSGVNAQPQLTALLGGTLSLGKTVIDNPSIEIDMRNRPAPSGDPELPPTKSGGSQGSGLNVVGDVVINNGNVRLTDTTGKTVEIGKVNSTLAVRPTGQTSSMQINMVVANAGQEAEIHASGNVTPAKTPSKSWSFKDTSGDLVVEVNDLELDSLAAVFELAGVEIETKGRLSANISGKINKGKVENVSAIVTGQNLDISGQAIKGDRIQTSALNVDAKLAQQGQTIKIEQLNAKTDWASISATGALPTTAKSLSDLLASESNYDLSGQFDCNLVAVMSQLPKTIGLKEGMTITSGQASGNISTTTQGGHATITAQTNITGLAGTVDGKDLALSEPVKADLKLTADGKKTQLDTLDVSAAFAKITASGDFEKIRYDGKINLSKLQAELGQFADLGPYQMAGDVTSAGQVAIGDETIVATGSSSVSQLVLTAADGNSVSEPKANLEYSLTVDQKNESLLVNALDVTASLGRASIRNGTVPLAETSPTPMKVDVVASGVDLAKAKPFAVFFASFPQKIDLGGLIDSQVAITGSKGTYRLMTEASTIRNLKLAVPEKTPFTQPKATLSFDASFNTTDGGINAESFLLESPQFKIMKGQYTQTAKGPDKTQIQGIIEANCDWAAVGQIASTFVPAGLEMTGQRDVSLNFTSLYSPSDPNSLLANLNGSARTGFDSANYMGLNVGATDVNVTVENGLMTVAPFTTSLNKGQISFAAKADFKEHPRLLRTPEPMALAKDIQIDKEMAHELLQYVNPIFANVTSVSGITDFQCEKLVIPMTAGMGNKAEVIGTFSANDVLLQASGLLDQILKATGEDKRGEILKIHPTRIVLKDGVVRYDDMQIDIGDNPINFGGAIGPNEKLDMTVTLPWTFKGLTARTDGKRQAGQRIPVPLGGTVTRPKLDLTKLLQQPDVIKNVFKDLFG